MTRASRLFHVGLSGPNLTSGEKDLLRRYPPGGIILFSRNLVDAEQTRALLQECRELVGPDGLLSVDQEGGRVDRLKVFDPPRPAAADLASNPEPWKAIIQAAKETARRLRQLGFDTAFAPVVDLEPLVEGTGLETRALGDDPYQVTLLARAWLQGLRAEGILGCLKHFPGLGGTRVDSHLDLPQVRWPAAAKERALLPYRTLAGETPVVMVAHCRYLDPCENQDPDAVEPASLSAHWIQDVLRHDLGFRGLVIADDLEMGALKRLGALPKLAVGALEAGADQVFLCSRLDQLQKSADLAAATLSPEALEIRWKRARRARGWWLSGSGELLDTPTPL